MSRKTAIVVFIVIAALAAFLLMPVDASHLHYVALWQPSGAAASLELIHALDPGVDVVDQINARIAAEPAGAGRTLVHFELYELEGPRLAGAWESRGGACEAVDLAGGVPYGASLVDLERAPSTSGGGLVGLACPGGAATRLESVSRMELEQALTQIDGAGHSVVDLEIEPGAGGAAEIVLLVAEEPAPGRTVEVYDAASHNSGLDRLRCALLAAPPAHDECAGSELSPLQPMHPIEIEVALGPGGGETWGVLLEEGAADDRLTSGYNHCISEVHTRLGGVQLAEPGLGTASCSEAPDPGETLADPSRHPYSLVDLEVVPAPTVRVARFNAVLGLTSGSGGGLPSHNPLHKDDESDAPPP